VYIFKKHIIHLVKDMSLYKKKEPYYLAIIYINYNHLLI